MRNHRRGPQGEGLMGGGQLIHIVDRATGGAPSVEILSVPRGPADLYPLDPRGDRLSPVKRAPAGNAEGEKDNYYLLHPLSLSGVLGNKGNRPPPLLRIGFYGD